MMKKILLLITRFVLGVIFIYAGGVKIMNPAAFAASIDNYRMLPYLMVTLMAAVLPWIEVTVGVLLVLGRWLKSSSLVIIVLNVIFIIAITSAMIRGLNIECGCFSVGGGGAQVGIVRLVEDVLYLILAVLIFRFAKPRAEIAPASVE